MPCESNSPLSSSNIFTLLRSSNKYFSNFLFSYLHSERQVHTLRCEIRGKIGTKRIENSVNINYNETVALNYYCDGKEENQLDATITVY